MTTIYLKERVKPYDQYIREMVYANTVHCTDWQKIEFNKPRPKKESRWFALCAAFLIGVLITTYAMMI